MTVSRRSLSTNVTAFKSNQTSSKLTWKQRKTAKTSDKSRLFDGSDFWPDSQWETNEKLHCGINYEDPKIRISFGAETAL